MAVHLFMPSGTQGACWYSAPSDTQGTRWYSGSRVVLREPVGTQEVITMQQTKNRIHSRMISARTDSIELWFKCREKTGRQRSKAEPEESKVKGAVVSRGAQLLF